MEANPELDSERSAAHFLVEFVLSIDRVYQKEKLLLKTGASILRQVGAGSSGEHSSVLPRSPIKTPQLNNSLNSHNSSKNYHPTKTYGLMANDLFSKAASAKGPKGVTIERVFRCVPVVLLKI